MPKLAKVAIDFARCFSSSVILVALRGTELGTCNMSDRLGSTIKGVTRTWGVECSTTGARGLSLISSSPGSSPTVSLGF